MTGKDNSPSSSDEAQYSFLSMLLGAVREPGYNHGACRMYKNSCGQGMKSLSVFEYINKVS